MASSFIARLVGGVALLFGIALGVLPILAIERQVAAYGTFKLPALIPTLVLWLISAFLLLVGCRLLLSRASANRSILSPMGWTLLAIICYALSIASVAAAVSSGQKELLIVAVGFCVLGYGSVKARKISRLLSPQSRVFPPETDLAKIPGFLPAGFRCGIEILNDDRTPMEFVVAVLEADVGLANPDAMRVMLEIHKKGGALLPLPSVEQSTQVAERIVSKARERDFLDIHCPMDRDEV